MIRLLLLGHHLLLVAETRLVSPEAVPAPDTVYLPTQGPLEHRPFQSTTHMTPPSRTFQDT